jgi:hypothetical protein
MVEFFETEIRMEQSPQTTPLLTAKTCNHKGVTPKLLLTGAILAGRR